MRPAPVWLLLVTAMVAAVLLALRSPSTAPIVLAEFQANDLELAGADPGQTAARHPVVVHVPDGAPRLVTDDIDSLGRRVTVACSTCHTLRPPDAATRATEDLDEFHQGLAYAHGQLACLACHNRDDYDSLRLADGAALQFPAVMTLCAQCHGPQARDYAHGAHGGMTGYWDLTRGPRMRNNCIDCHDPHAPAFPRMMPVFKPKDRFLTPSSARVKGSHE